MKHSYTVLLAIMLAVIAISVFFPRSQFVEGLDMDDSNKDVKENMNDESDSEDDSDHEEDGTKKVDEPQGADHTQQHATYKSEEDCPDTVCLWKNKQKDNMDLVKAGNSVEDHDTTETFANWNPSWQ